MLYFRMLRHLQTIALIARWLIAAVLLFAALRMLHGAMRSDNSLAVLGQLLVGMAMLVAAPIVVRPTLARWAAAPINALLDSIYLPTTTEPPPVDYTLAHLYRRQRRYAESLEEYRKIIHYHPQEVGAYLEGIQTAFAWEAPEMAAQIYRRGRRRLRTPADQEVLREAFASRRLTNAV